MGRLDELEAFVHVVQEESFSEAARRLGISKSYVSKQISRLEDRLEARLLNRTTRQLQLTDIGALFYERCVLILGELEQAERAVTAMQSTPTGTLRLSVPVSFGVRFLSPMLAGFMCDHQELDVEVSYSDRVVNIVDEGFDLAVRIGQLADSSLFVRKLADVENLLCASPSYLERRGRPQRPGQLREHACLRYTYQSTGAMWRLLGGEAEEEGAGEEEFAFKPEGPMLANNGDALVEAALHGVGIALLPDFFVREALEQGRLERVLPGWSAGARAGIWAMYPHNRHMSAKVRLFVDFLVERFVEPNWQSA